MGDKKKKHKEENLSVFHLARWHLMSEVSQDGQMYSFVVVLSCSVTLKEHTHMHGHLPLRRSLRSVTRGVGGV